MLGAAGPRLRAMLDSMRVQQATPKLLRLGVPASCSAMAHDHLPDIVRLVQETGARSMSIQFVDLKPEEPAPPKGEAHGEGAPHPSSSDEMADEVPSPAIDPREADTHPLVRRAAEVFGAKVTHIHPKRR